VTLEDDDQRKFEAGLPRNTVAFAASQVSVQERDPAVQIDLVRFNPDDTSLVAGFVVRDVTATAGKDYFPPSGYTITFGPGQRSARLLIPLVQDSEYEGDEAFVVELSTGDSLADMDVYYRVAVMIRDDDTG
jgi:Calx-beta domain